MSGVAGAVQLPPLRVGYEARQPAQRRLDPLRRADESVDDATDRESVADEEHRAVVLGDETAGRLADPRYRLGVRFRKGWDHLRFVIEADGLEPTGQVFPRKDLGFRVEPLGVAVFAESGFESKFSTEFPADLVGRLDSAEKGRGVDGVERLLGFDEPAADSPRRPAAEFRQRRIVNALGGRVPVRIDGIPAFPVADHPDDIGHLVLLVVPGRLVVWEAARPRNPPVRRTTV
jgi:hypothetical protein